MAIIDETFEIAQRLHQIRADRTATATGADLDKIGAEYGLSRDPMETEFYYRCRIVDRITKVMRDGEAAERQRRENEDKIVFIGHGASDRKRFWAKRTHTT